MLTGFAGAAAGLLAAGAASAAATPLEIFDDRAAKKKGFDLIYEARDLDLPQSVRDGMTQVGLFNDWGGLRNHGVRSCCCGVR